MLASAVVLAVTAPGSVPAAVDQTIGPGLGGFLVTFFMAVALVILVRSMVKHLRKVRYSPDPAQRPTRQTAIRGPAAQPVPAEGVAWSGGEGAPEGSSDGGGSDGGGSDGGGSDGGGSDGGGSDGGGSDGGGSH